MVVAVGGIEESELEDRRRKEVSCVLSLEILTALLLNPKVFWVANAASTGKQTLTILRAVMTSCLGSSSPRTMNAFLESLVLQEIL